MESFDIFDEHRCWLGTAARAEVHARGYWHQTFHCWIMSEEDGVPCLLFQRRHPAKDTFPGLLDISCAGHLQAGESVEDGIRELEEELGLETAFADLLPCGIYASRHEISPVLIDNEFCHVFVYSSNRELGAYRLQDDEVTGLYRIPVEEVKRLIRGETGAVTAIGLEADEAGILRPVICAVEHRHLVPHEPDYYELVFEGIAKLATAACRATE